MWIYKEKEIQDSDVLPLSIGFLYIITHLPSGRKYLGKKLLTKAATKTVKGKKKKIRKDSGWKDYWSSSPWLTELIEKEGVENFSKEILMFAFSKGELNFLEESLQYKLGVLESDYWMNSNIRSRIFKRNVMKYPGLIELGLVQETLTRQQMLPMSPNSSTDHETSDSVDQNNN